MSDEKWAFPEQLRPRQDTVDFDLDGVLNAVVRLRAEVPQAAFTAAGLGTERAGYGIVLDDEGLVVTIGYLVTEATSITLTDNFGVSVSAYTIAYDHVTGFGLLRAIEPLRATALPRGESSTVARGDRVFVVGQGGSAHTLEAKVIEKREFAGYWEYLLDEALFTSPAHPEWGGAALVDDAGRLVGVGSLLVQTSIGGQSSQGNMFVPVDLLNRYLDDLLTLGHFPGPPRPWLGMFVMESSNDDLVVSGLSPTGPAAEAGVHAGDIVRAVDDEPVATLAGFLHAVRRQGSAGSTVSIELTRSGQRMTIEVTSADRRDFLLKPVLN